MRGTAASRRWGTLVMSRVLYFDCFSGISGDMVLGALLDAGLPLDELKRALGSLAVAGYDVTAERVLRAGVSATKFIVHEHATSDQRPAPQHAAARPAPRHQHPRIIITPSRTCSLPEIFALIDRSALSPAGRDRAKALFQRLAEAEAAIHQMPVEKVHLHEVGALDSIIDIVGAVFALEWVGADRIVCSPLNVGGGMVQSAHGLFPVPAPATVRLLGDAPIYSGAGAEGAGHADRRADRHELRVGVRPDSGDVGRARRLRRRRPRRTRRRRTCCACSSAAPPTGRASRSRRRHRVRDRRHEPADLRRRRWIGSTRPARSRCSTSRCR